MLNHYEGWSESDLLVLRRTLQGQSATGQVLRTSIAGVSVEKSSVGSGTSQVLTLRRVQYALWLIGNVCFLSDATENPYQNPYTASVKRTRTSYV